MFKPSTVLIQADVDGGNDNLFDAVQDYLVQSFNNIGNHVENKNENKTGFIDQIDEKIESNQNMMIPKNELISLKTDNEEEEKVKMNEFEDLVNLNESKKKKLLSGTILSRYKETKQKNSAISDQNVIFTNRKIIRNGDDDNDDANNTYREKSNTENVKPDYLEINGDGKIDFRGSSKELFLIHRFVILIELRF